jgi:hypothetical protein
MRRSWLQTSTVFGPSLESSGPSLHSSGPLGSEVNDAWVDSWRDLLQDVFAWQRRLLTRGGEVDGLAYPLHWPTAHSRSSRV